MTVQAAPTFHAGEIALQQRTGAAERMAQIGPRVIREAMPQQHRDFFEVLPFVLAGTVDASGQPWASVLAGRPGFMQSPHERALHIDALPLLHDPLGAGLYAGAPVGLLGIEPRTRRRNRVNGWVEHVDGAGFAVRVAQSFGNCPKYIQARHVEYAPRSVAPGPAQRSSALDAQARRSIAEADTFFIASAHPRAGPGSATAEGVDVSHRGGKPGFIHIEGNNLTVPDYAGNFFFNTLGNLTIEARCGLLFIDGERGDLTWMAARAELVLEGAQLRAYPGAQRLLRLEVASFLRAPGCLPLRWGPAEQAPELAAL